MKRISLKILRKVVQLITKCNPKFPYQLEIASQNIQGKGSGAFSTEVEAKIALDFITRSGIKKPVVLDIGANIGSYSEAIRKSAPQSKVFAFEPSSVARKKLQERFIGDRNYKFKRNFVVGFSRKWIGLTFETQNGTFWY